MDEIIVAQLNSEQYFGYFPTDDTNGRGQAAEYFMVETLAG
jgi:hypothetical protein